MRMLRLLKPLRSIKALKTLRKMITLLLQSIASLLNVFIFMAFVFSIFAVLGVNLFCGNQYRMCRTTPDIIYPEDGSDPYWPKFEDLNALCYTNEQCVEFTGVETAVCGSTWERAELDPVKYDGVRENELILYGIPSFDNFFAALFTVFQVCTLESWAYLMENYADSNEHGFLSYIFFPLMIFFGGFFTMNLILAQILDKFN